MPEREAQVEITQILAQRDPAVPIMNQLLPVVYEQLRRIAARRLRSERTSHTLSPTSLVHEVYLRLIGSDASWHDRGHFYAAAALAMRRILVDHARRRGAAKRGGQWQQVTLDEGLEIGTPDVAFLDFHNALEKLEALDPDATRIVELRFFVGLTLDDTAKVLGISRRKVAGDWAVARAWLRQQLEPCQ